MDPMATLASAQVVPAGFPNVHEPLPFYFRFNTAGNAGVDILSQDVRLMPDRSRVSFGLCFPPVTMVGVVLQHLAKKKAHAVIIVPDQRQTWYPSLVAASVDSVPVASEGDSQAFFRQHHQQGQVPVVLTRWNMRAVEVDFRI